MRAARKLTRRPDRAATGLFLAEGPQAVREALAVPGLVREVFALPDTAHRHPDLADAGARAGAAWYVADPQAIAALTDSVHPQGVVAVCRSLDVPVQQVLGGHARLLAMCADVRDPGNAGTVIRCADAAGAGGVLLLGSSVDPYNGKVVRASAGSLFHVPVALAGDPVATVAEVRAAGLQVLAADAGGDTDLDAAADDGLLAAPTAWLFGNEAHGLPDALADRADLRVRIPIHGRAESLNLATAAAVCLYASARAQRARA
ncbi:MAG TPA: RNA methyltransferase [Nocardioidaceae bacterium]|nr:RNA methyltransferase [Nocardioidaceae bacterium]